MKLSLSEQLVLGILAEQARHGYDVEKLIKERGMRKWTDIGFSSIYYILDKLEAKKLVSGSDSMGRSKKQYTITAEGIAALKAKAQTLIAERRPANAHLMTGLAISELIEGTELNTALQQRRKQIMSDLAAIREKQQALKTESHAARRLFRLSEALLEAEHNWIREELERITQ